jgi:hypothetical protein
MTFPFDGQALGAELVASVIEHIDLTLAPLKAQLAEVQAENATLRGHLNSRLADMEARFNEFSDSPRARYLGVHNRVTKYLPGDITTHQGTLWACLRPTTGSIPGQDGEAWLLMAKNHAAEKVEALERRLSVLETPGRVTDIRKVR